MPTPVVLDERGFGDVTVTWETTSVPGSTAEQWADNEFGLLDKLDAALDADPPADLLLLVIGGNDLLGEVYDGYGNRLSIVQQQIRNRIVADVGEIVDHALAERSHLQVVIIGYGWCGRGVATRASGMGAHVTICEINPLRALEAVMDGFAVCPMAQAAEFGELFITVTGNKHVIRPEHFEKMRDGAVVCNSGHFDIEIDIPGLGRMAKTHTPDVRRHVDEFRLTNGRRIYLLAEGRLINLAAAEGHPASVMDMSFATQALTTEWVIKQGKLPVKVHDVPDEIEDWVSSLKLQSMSVSIDQLTKEQIAYLASSTEGT